MGLPQGLSDKNPPATAGDLGSIPGPGGSHMPWATKPMSHTCQAWAQSRNHNYLDRVPQLLKPPGPRACALQQGRPLQRQACALQWRIAPAPTEQRKAYTAMKTHTAKTK